MILANYDPLEYWVLIPKGIEILMFIILAIKIRMLKNYTVNKLYCAAFLSWATYIILNSIIYLIAANGEKEFQIATFIHRIALCLAMIVALLFFTAALVIKHGFPAFKKPIFAIFVIITLGMCILALMTQEFIIVNENGTELSTVEQWTNAQLVRVSFPITPIAGILLSFPLFIFLYTVIYLYRLANKKVAEPALKKKMKNLILGISLIILGMVYFIFIQYIEQVNIITASIGHIIWTLSPIFIWRSQKKSSDPPK